MIKFVVNVVCSNKGQYLEFYVELDKNWKKKNFWVEAIRTNLSWNVSCKAVVKLYDIRLKRAAYLCDSELVQHSRYTGSFNHRFSFFFFIRFILIYVSFFFNHLRGINHWSECLWPSSNPLQLFWWHQKSNYFLWHISKRAALYPSSPHKQQNLPLNLLCVTTFDVTVASHGLLMFIHVTTCYNSPLKFCSTFLFAKTALWTVSTAAKFSAPPQILTK